MIIYSNGCSHTADMGANFHNVYIDIVAKELLKTYEKIYACEGHYNKNKNFKFYELNSDKNYLIKHAEHGKSNDLIFFESYNIIKNAINDNVKLDYVVIQFSGVNRRIHTLPNGGLLSVNPWDNSALGVKFEPFATEQSLQYLLILQDLLNQNFINYVFIPYMEFDSDVLSKSDKLDYIDNERLSTSLFSGHRNDFRKRGMTVDASGHPNFLGYYELATIVLDKFHYAKDNMKDIETYFSKRIRERDLYKDEPGIRWIKKYGDILGDGTEDEVDEARGIQKKPKNNLI